MSNERVVAIDEPGEDLERPWPECETDELPEPEEPTAGKPVAMTVTLGAAGLTNSWQRKFPTSTKCCQCGGKARIGFVASEGHTPGAPDFKDGAAFVADLHPNLCEDGGFWLHDACAVAVYFCKKCLNPTALYNQG